MVRIVRILLLAILFISLASGIAYGYLYRAPVAITENASTSYTMLPVMWNQNNTWLANNGFMSSSANDTRVQTLGGLNKPHLVADNKTLTAIPVAADSQTNLYFVTGESAASAMDIITGYGGYVTANDTASMELSNNFSIEMTDTYIDTSAGANKILARKPSAFDFSVSDLVTGTVFVSIPGFSGKFTSYETGQDAVRSVYGVFWSAQTFTIASSTSVNVTSIEFYTQRAGTVGTVTASIRATLAGLPTGADLVSGTANGDLWGVGLAYNSVTMTTSYRLTPGQYAIVFRVLSAGGGANLINWGYDTAGATYAGGNFCTSTNSGVSWANSPNADFLFKLNGQTFVSVSAVGITSDEHDVIVSADSTNLTLTIDGVLQATTAITAVPDTADNWQFGSANTTPYIGGIKYYVGGNLIVWYEPNDIISGTVLPDRQGGDQNGIITWGSNPAGVNVSLGSMTSSGQSSIGASSDTSTGDILPGVGGTDWRPVTGVSAQLQANPLRPIVTAISDNTTLSEYQVWVWFGIIFVLFITALVGANVRGHHLITGIAASAAIILPVVWTIFPPPALLVVVIAIVGGLISERSPSL